MLGENEEIKKFEYLDNEKSVLGEISIFHTFSRAFFW